MKQHPDERVQQDMFLRSHPDVIAQRMNDKVVLLHLGTNRFYELNSTGARLWDLLSAGHSVVEIQQQLLLEFDVEPARLDAEIAAILTSLQEKDLVHASDAR